MIAAQILHADTVAQHCAACERTRWINSDNCHTLAFFAKVQCQLIDQRRFAGAGCARHANEVCFTSVRKKSIQRVASIGSVILNLS